MKPFADIPWYTHLMSFHHWMNWAHHLPYITPRHEGTAPAANTTRPWNCRCKFQSSLSMSMWHLEMELGSVLKGSACNSYTGIHPCRLRHEPHRRAWSLSRKLLSGPGMAWGETIHLPRMEREWIFQALFVMAAGAVCSSQVFGLWSRCEFLAEYLWKEIHNEYTQCITVLYREPTPPNEYWLMQMVRQPIR